jgi:hypothetical protein
MKYADTPITAANDSPVNSHRRHVMRRRVSESGSGPLRAS